MRQQFVDKEKIQHVIDGFNKLYEHMINTNTVDADDIKNFMEPYFEEAGYRDKSIKSKAKSNKHKSKNDINSDVKNILIIHDAGIGDFITISAAIREVRRIYPKSHINLMTRINSVSAAEFCPYIDKLITSTNNFSKYKEFFNFYKKAINFAKMLLRRKFDIVFNFGHYPSSQVIAYMSGAKEIVDSLRLNANTKINANFTVDTMPPDFFSALSTVDYIDFSNLKNPHISENYLHILSNYSKTGIHNKNLEVWLSPLDISSAEQYLQDVNDKNIYAIILGSSINYLRKRWAPENYAKLINMILAEEDAMFVILGGDVEIEEAKVVESLVDKNHIINFTNKLNFRQSAAVLSFCDCYIGNDTGMMHVAAALKIPVLSPNCFPVDIKMTVSAYTQTYYPYGVPSVIVQPKHALPDCQNSKHIHRITFGCVSDKPHCINQITPENMFQAFKHLQKQIAKNETEPVFFNL